MSFLIDSNGFYQPVIFLLASIIILIVAYKKKATIAWLAIIPILLIPIYDRYQEVILVERSQKEYVLENWSNVYGTDFIDVEKTEEVDDELYDEWKVSTENGSYRIRFNKGKSNGFQIAEELNGAESLLARRNVIDTMDTLDIEGTLEYVDEEEYILHEQTEDYSVTMNEEKRVESIVDDENNFIYKNEEMLHTEDGRLLTEEEAE